MFCNLLEGGRDWGGRAAGGGASNTELIWHLVPTEWVEASLGYLDSASKKEKRKTPTNLALVVLTPQHPPTHTHTKAALVVLWLSQSWILPRVMRSPDF